MAFKYKLRSVGFVGSGGVAHALGLLASKAGLELGFYDIVHSRAEHLASKLGGRHFSGLRELIAFSDLIVVAVPGVKAPGVLEGIFKLMGGMEGVGVTDVSTYKAAVIQSYTNAPARVYVASSHPLFGRRVRKPHAHRAIIVPIPGRFNDADYIEDFYNKIGVKTYRVDWRTHDYMVLRTIALSYLIGYTLWRIHEDTPRELLDAFRSTTFSLVWTLANAIAGDPPDLIREILENRGVQDLIKDYMKMLEEIMDGRIVLARKDNWPNAYECIYRFVEDVVMECS